MFNGTYPATVTGYQYRHAKFSFRLASTEWTDAGQETNLTVASLEGGTLYYFEVRALNGVTPEGAPSPAVIGISGAFDSGSTAVTGQDSVRDVIVDTPADTLALDDPAQPFRRPGRGAAADSNTCSIVRSSCYTHSDPIGHSCTCAYAGPAVHSCTHTYASPRIQCGHDPAPNGCRYPHAIASANSGAQASTRSRVGDKSYDDGRFHGNAGPKRRRIRRLTCMGLAAYRSGGPGHSRGGGIRVPPEWPRER